MFAIVEWRSVLRQPSAFPRLMYKGGDSGLEGFLIDGLVASPDEKHLRSRNDDPKILPRRVFKPWPIWLKSCARKPAAPSDKL